MLRNIVFFCRISNISLLRVHSLFFLTSAKIVNIQQKWGGHVENTKFSLDPK